MTEYRSSLKKIWKKSNSLAAADSCLVGPGRGPVNGRSVRGVRVLRHLRPATSARGRSSSLSKSLSPCPFKTSGSPSSSELDTSVSDTSISDWSSSSLFSAPSTSSIVKTSKSSSLLGSASRLAIICKQIWHTSAFHFEPGKHVWLAESLSYKYE